MLVKVAEICGSVYPTTPPAVTVAVVTCTGPVAQELGWPPVFVGGVGAVNTDASMVMFAWFTLSPLLSVSKRRRVAEHLMRAGLVYATAIGKRPVIINGTRGIRQMAQRIGLASGTSFEVLMGEMP